MESFVANGLSKKIKKKKKIKIKKIKIIEQFTKRLKMQRCKFNTTLNKCPKQNMANTGWGNA
jgi:hypothetical protein